MNKKYSIIVNSSDDYQDCWPPFFVLFKKYWPESDATIYLNTGKKDWSDQCQEKIICTKVENNENKRLTWSECLIKALDMIETPLVLYLQEDYFIDKMVSHDRIENYASIMLSNCEIGCINLSRHGGKSNNNKFLADDLSFVGQNVKYRVSTQAALWRVDTLKSYLSPEENGWMFEIYGTWRSRRRKDIFLTANFSENIGGACIDYLHTGVIKGKWNRSIAKVFEKNDINVDYEIRGFYNQKNLIIRKIETLIKILGQPNLVLRNLWDCL